MSYQVLARKWRPKNFKDLIGQNSVVRILTNALKNNRLHPSLIFAGPRGTGKTSTARILAKNLSCPDVFSYFKTSESNKLFQSKKFWDLNPCNKCKTCQDIDNSRSLDVLEIDGASNNGVEAVRQLKETITYLPAGPYKIYIIDEVHMLSVSAFNALLKTLEEPPPHALFIMATTEMRKIPATVLSRSQILQFHQIADHLIYEQLKKICEKEKTQADSGALWMLVRESQGSLRDAQGLLDQMITFCHKKFKVQDVSDILGLTDRSLLMQSIKGILEKSPNQILIVLNQLQTKGGDPALFLHNLIKEMRNLLLLKQPASDSLKNLVPLSEQEKTILKQWSQELNSEDCHLLLDMALKGSWEINRVQDPKVFLEMLLLKMSEAPYIESLFGEKAFWIPDQVRNDKRGVRTNEEVEVRHSGVSQNPVKEEKVNPSDKSQNLVGDTDFINLKSGQAFQRIPVQTRNTESSSRGFSLHQDDEKTKVHHHSGVNNKKIQNNKEFRNDESLTPSPQENHEEVHKHMFIQELQSLFKADILDSKDR